MDEMLRQLKQEYKTYQEHRDHVMQKGCTTACEYASAINMGTCLARGLMEYIDSHDTGDTRSRWISPAEQLPERNVDIVATVMNNGAFDTYGRGISFGFLNQDGEWDGDLSLKTVIAWMYLPEPYTGR